MTLVVLHTILGRAFSYFALIVAGWALILLLRKEVISSNFWGAVVIGEGLIVLQTLVGVIMWIQGALPARTIHFLYGAVALLTWPALFAATRGYTSRRDNLWWVLASAFLFGIALRATSTGAFG